MKLRLLLIGLLNFVLLNGLVAKLPTYLTRPNGVIMVIISSIQHYHITNYYNDGANYFKRFYNMQR